MRIGRSSALKFSAGLTLLQKLHVGWCTNISDQDVLSLSALINLTELELARSKVSSFSQPLNKNLSSWLRVHVVRHMLAQLRSGK